MGGGRGRSADRQGEVRRPSDGGALRSGRSRGQAVALVRGRPGIAIELRCDMAGIIAGPAVASMPPHHGQGPAAEGAPLTHPMSGERHKTPDRGPDLRSSCVAPASNA
ncbi:MAG: hypothetical protein A2V84_03550 [Chloroflexi bacterium RBG_16_70_13]|nr:MAG: hypothetical protein A2V84_03550 [Chloroflexi bacterium RBG_16_70_13]